jgi:hypothetical protein
MQHRHPVWHGRCLLPVLLLVLLLLLLLPRAQPWLLLLLP